jgi:hypothetical protein
MFAAFRERGRQILVNPDQDVGRPLAIEKI